jgi:putative methyltransferase (TIGR04325 family)
MLPPAVVRLYLTYLNTRYGFHGDYSSWEDARSHSYGYNHEAILSKVKKAALRVKNGEAAYEQDSVLHMEPAYSWPILASLMRVASLNHNRLHVLDFGGSLGSSYYQHRGFLGALSELRWAIVEQENFVRCGKAGFEDAHLHFYYDLATCVRQEDVQVILLSSVLPYLEKPYDLLREILSLNIRHVIIDRHPLLPSSGRDRLTVQKVRPSTYRASYPAWFFSKHQFLQFISERYQIVASFDCPLWSNLRCEWKGFVLETRST